MKTIGFVVYDISLTGGAENVALNMAKELSKNYDVHMVTLFDEKKFVKEDKPYTVHILNEKTVPIPTHLFSLSNRLRQIIKQNKIDVLFVITAGVVTVAALASLMLKVKTVYCEHSNLENKTYGKKHELRQFIGANFCDKVVTLTERDRLNFIKQYHLCELGVLAIPNWFTYDENFCAKYATDSKKIITAGRLEYVKGYDLLLKAASIVKQKHPDWHWDIYGEGKFRSEVEKWIVDNDVEDFVTLKGNVSDLGQRYKDYSMFVMTSYYEGLPLVLLEAQVANLPIVSFDCPTGPAEIVEDGKNGYLVPTYDTDLLAEKINCLIENSEMRMQFSANAKGRLPNFSKPTVCAKWINLIENI